MDERTIIRIIRSVKAIDFFNEMDGADVMDTELFDVCSVFLKTHLGSQKKSVIQMKIDGYNERIEKMMYAQKHVKKVGDEHYNLLVSYGVEFEEGKTVESFLKVGNRFIHKLKKLKEGEEEQIKSVKDKTSEYEESVANMSYALKIKLDVNMSLAEYVAYVKLYKKIISDGKKRN